MVLLLPMRCGGVALMELPIKGDIRQRRTFDLWIWDATRIAMVTRRRPSAKCIACEAWPTFGWLLNELMRGLEIRALAWPLEDHAGEARVMSSADAIVASQSILAIVAFFDGTRRQPDC
jgi:hypothetical protein